MSDFPSKQFTVGFSESLDGVPRAARRLIFNADVLKAAKVCAGDVVALSSRDPPHKVRLNCVTFVLYPADSLMFDGFLYIGLCCGGCVAHSRTLPGQ
jgi:hypothetical protein